MKQKHLRPSARKVGLRSKCAAPSFEAARLRKTEMASTKVAVSMPTVVMRFAARSKRGMEPMQEIRSLIEAFCLAAFCRKVLHQAPRGEEQQVVTTAFGTKSNCFDMILSTSARPKDCIESIDGCVCQLQELEQARPWHNWLRVRSRMMLHGC